MLRVAGPNLHWLGARRGHEISRLAATMRSSRHNLLRYLLLDGEVGVPRQAQDNFLIKKESGTVLAGLVKNVEGKAQAT
jgi:hypothetical protein